MAQHRIFVDGVQDGRVSGNDPGLTRGLSVFETLRTYGGRPFRLEEHIERFAASCDAVGLGWPGAAAVSAEISSRLAGLDLADDVWIRYTVTAGGCRILELQSIDQGYVGRPIRVASVEMEPYPFLPGFVKHGSRAAWNVATRQLGVDEIVMVDRAGHILEANRSSVLAVIGGVVAAPPDDGRRLRGVTLGALLEAAAGEGLDVERRELPVTAAFDELYLTSTLKELAPVAELDGRAVGGGPVGAHVLAAFRALVAAS